MNKSFVFVQNRNEGKRKISDLLPNVTPKLRFSDRRKKNMRAEYAQVLMLCRFRQPPEERIRLMTIKRGEIYYADLSPVVGSEQGGVRPVLIVQNDIGNKHSPTVIAAAITSQREKTKLPTHISLDAVSCGLSKDSVVLLEQVRTLDKKRLKERMGELGTTDMHKVDSALSVSFGLG